MIRPNDPSPPPPESEQPSAELHIDTSAGRRWIGWAGYILLYLLVGALLVLVFVKLSAPLMLAVGVVVFMIGYMSLMGYLASRNINRRE
jgi:Flp pilus assembly protein TadB